MVIDWNPRTKHKTLCTVWRRPIGYLKSQVSFRKGATYCRALLRKMTYNDNASYGLSPPCKCVVYTQSMSLLRKSPIKETIFYKRDLWCVVYTQSLCVYVWRASSFFWHATFTCTHTRSIRWLQLVGFLKLQVSFAEYRLFYRALLQQRPIILRSLLIEATP